MDTLLSWADIGTKAHTSERLTSLLRQVPRRLGEGQTKQVLACLIEPNEKHRAGHGGDGEDRDAWLVPENRDELTGW